ncbi:pgtA, partial [Symbiodinium pilosum]
EETLQILKDWRALPNVQVVRSDKSAGVGPALNFGWNHCQGQYISRLDGDDIALPSRLSQQLGFLEKHASIAILGGGFRTFTEDSAGLNLGARQYRFPCHPLLARWHMIFSCSLAHPTVMLRRAAIPFREGPYPENEEAEDHCCWLSMPLDVQIANIADVVCHIRRHSESRSATAAHRLRQSSYGAVRAFLKRECAEDNLTDSDIAVLWGSKGASTPAQATAVSHALDSLQGWFNRILHPQLGRDLLPGAFRSDFLDSRTAALEEYVKASCNKLRGTLAVQSLASGEVDVGAAMMKQWLKGGDAGLKSLGALIQAGYNSQGSQ